MVKNIKLFLAMLIFNTHTIKSTIYTTDQFQQAFKNFKANIEDNDNGDNVGCKIS